MEKMAVNFRRIFELITCLSKWSIKDDWLPFVKVSEIIASGFCRFPFGHLLFIFYWKCPAGQQGQKVITGFRLGYSIPDFYIHYIHAKDSFFPVSSVLVQNREEMDTNKNPIPLINN